MPDLYTLYGAQISNYTAKVRSALLYKQLPFQEVVASNAVYDELLVPTFGYRMMPLLRVPSGALLQDSTDIVDYLEGLSPERSVYPLTPRQRLANYILEAYAHDWLRIPTMYFRWAFPEHNYEYLKAEFGRMYEPSASREAQLAIGDRGCAWTRDRLPALGVNAQTAPKMAAWMDRLLGWLDTHFTESDYLFGSRPSSADLTLMGPLYGHMYRDPYSFALMQRISPNVLRWVERMNSKSRPAGAFLENDAVPKTLFPLLRHAFAEYVPVAYDTIDIVKAWFETTGQTIVPRFLGEHTYTIDGVSAPRAVWTCIQYMIQRPLFYFQRSPEPDRSAMKTLLASIAPEASLQKTVDHTLVHQGYTLVVER